MFMKRYVLAMACLLIQATAIVSVGFAEKEKEGTVPASIVAAVKAVFPKANIKETAKEKESIEVYESAIIDDNKECDVTVSTDGMIASAESYEQADALPDAIKAAAAGGKISEAVKEVTYAELRYVKLSSPTTTYEMTVEKDGKEVEMKVSADGKIISQKVEEADKEENGKEGEKGKEKEGKENEKKGEHKDKGEKDNDEKN
jgi:hypothetical protein